jgi:acetyl esterase/lipase
MIAHAAEGLPRRQCRTLLAMRVPLVTALVALATAGCGAPTASASSAATPSFAGAARTTVTYCTDGGLAQRLDVYEPSAGTAPRPLLIVVHGGSWAFGNSALDEQNPLTQLVVNGVLAHGFAVASINYRLAPRDPWPAQIVDTRCAIRYLRATAALWHIDPHRFAALGNSAGGQLVSVDALSAGQEPQWNSAQYAGEPSDLSAVVDCWGPADLSATGWSKVAVAIGRPVFGVTVGSQTDVLRRASPVTYVHSGAPPFLIVQGSSDALVPPRQSAELQSRLLAAGASAVLLAVAHAGHELIPSGGAIAPTVAWLAQRAVAFLVSVAG